MKKDILTFDEAIALFHVGAFGFKFQSQRNDVFTSKLDAHQRLQILPVTDEGETK